MRYAKSNRILHSLKSSNDLCALFIWEATFLATVPYYLQKIHCSLATSTSYTLYVSLQPFVLYNGVSLGPVPSLHLNCTAARLYPGCEPPLSFVNIVAAGPIINCQSSTIRIEDVMYTPVPKPSNWIRCVDQIFSAVSYQQVDVR